jgi:hypothetical protein
MFAMGEDSLEIFETQLKIFFGLEKPIHRKYGPLFRINPSLRRFISKAIGKHSKISNILKVI